MVSSSTWTSDKLFGESVEDYLAPKLMKRYGWDFYKMDHTRKNSDYDIQGIYKNGSTHNIEVKADRTMVSTRRFIVECRSSGRPSGILTTKSDDWYIVAATGTCKDDLEIKRMYCVPLEYLKHLVKNEKPFKILRTNEVYIFDESLIQQYAVTL